MPYLAKYKHIKLPWVRHENRKRRPGEQAFYNSPAWRKLSAQLRRTHKYCVLCSAKGVATLAQHIDHIVPVRCGGAKLDTRNLCALCMRCHNKKSSLEGKRNAPIVRTCEDEESGELLPAEGWLQELQEQLNAGEKSE